MIVFLDGKVHLPSQNWYGKTFFNISWNRLKSQIILLLAFLHFGFFAFE